MRRNTVLMGRMPSPLYHTYYEHQVGSGISEVFRGREFQRGHGIGSIFSGLFRLAKPLLARGAKAVGRQALNTSSQILDDIMQGHNVKEAMKTRITEGGRSLAGAAKRKLNDMQEGKGYKRARVTNCAVNRKKTVKKTTTRARKPVKRKTAAQKGAGIKKKPVKRGKLAAKFKSVPFRKRITKKQQLTYKDIF
jgi:hypothetical protein